MKQLLFCFQLFLPVLTHCISQHISIHVVYCKKWPDNILSHTQMGASSVLQWVFHKPRVVSDGNQSIHTCGCYTCVQSFIDSICQRKLDLDFGQRRLIIPNPNILFALKSQTTVTNSLFCATCQQLLWLLLCQTLIVTFIRYQPPNTPECDHASEKGQEHLHHLQMTDPDHCCAHRQSNTPPPVLPIPQPNFGQPIFVQVSTKTTFTIIVLLMSLTQPS